MPEGADTAVAEADLEVAVEDDTQLIQILVFIVVREDTGPKTA